MYKYPFSSWMHIDHAVADPDPVFFGAGGGAITLKIIIIKPHFCMNSLSVRGEGQPFSSSLDPPLRSTSFIFMSYWFCVCGGASG